MNFFIYLITNAQTAINIKIKRSNIMTHSPFSIRLSYSSVTIPFIRSVFVFPVTEHTYNFLTVDSVVRMAMPVLSLLVHNLSCI